MNPVQATITIAHSTMRGARGRTNGPKPVNALAATATIQTRTKVRDGQSVPITLRRRCMTIMRKGENCPHQYARPPVETGKEVATDGHDGA